MRRLLCFLLLLLLLLPAIAQAAGLKNAATIDDVNRYVTMPQNGELPPVERGTIRFMTLNDKHSAFCLSAWHNYGYDLTTRMDASGRQCDADMRNMHGRAAYCMAMSYLGVDMTPALMSQMRDNRDILAPFDYVTAQLDGVERVKYSGGTYSASDFDTMVSRYLMDSRYSPVMVEFQRPDGMDYTVLIVGRIPSTGGFIILDPAAPWQDGQYHHAYKMAWHVMRVAVLSSAFYDTFYGSETYDVYQWKLTE